MMVWSINLLVLAVGFLIIGMFKPGWILFWMEKPGRFPIVFLSTALFMAAAIMFGEANKQHHNLTTAFEMHEKATEQDSVPTVVTEPEAPVEAEILVE